MSHAVVSVSWLEALGACKLGMSNVLPGLNFELALFLEQDRDQLRGEIFTKSHLVR